MSEIFSEILVRYGELALKSPPVRKFLEKKLVNNIDRTLRNNNIPAEKFQVSNHRKWGRIIVVLYNNESVPCVDHTDKELEEKIVNILSNYVCGITSISPAQKITSNIEEIFEKAIEFITNRVEESSTFAVRVKRTGKHPYSSQELAGKIGEHILEKIGEEKKLTVNLSQPDYTLHLEVKDHYAFLFDKKLTGIGGFPQSSQGKLVTVLRGSREDAIAAFLLCKRGAIVLPIAFERKNTEQYSANVKSLEKQLKVFQEFQPIQKSAYIKVDFDSILEKIGFERLQCSTCDKVCIGVTERIIKDQHKQGIILGNANDTILHRNPEKNFDEKFVPIYYPLIALDPNSLKQPFSDAIPNKFCLESCPGLENQSKKKIKPPTQQEITNIVASANFAMVRTDSCS